MEGGKKRSPHSLLKGGTIMTITMSALLIAAGCVAEEPPPTGNEIIGNVSGTALTLPGKITIDGIGEFGFDPAEVTPVRDDLFAPGHFSIYAVLAHLDETGQIDLDARFDEEMNTWAIEGINGIGDWWYMAYYDGGWPETNAFRMDHYPYKDGMYISVIHDDPAMIERKYQVFRDEISRKEQNGGRVIIPEVVIRGPSTDLRFEEVEVTPHDLRTDIVQPGVITAVDIIMSLGDQNQLSYDLRWRDSIGSAEIVRSYWIDRIDNDEAAFRCGFVYETGGEEFRGFRGNHIPIPTDTRILESPGYAEWFWICL